jgi:hypothetical protein
MQDARPTEHKKRSEKRLKGKVLSVRVSPEEHQAVEAFAEREGLSTGSYVRSRVLEQPTTRAIRRPPVEVRTLSVLQASLNKVGSNLNQIARALNSGETVTIDDIQTALKEHRHILAAIITTVGRHPR